MALTGVLYDGICYPSLSVAVDLFYGKVPPSLTSGTTSYMTEYYSTGGVWHQKQWSIASNGTKTARYDVIATIPSFPVCDPTAQFFDGISVGWGIAAAMVVAASFAMMRKAAR